MAGLVPNCTSGSSSKQNTTVASVLLLPLSLTTLLLNLLSFCVLVRSKKVRKSKFLCVLISLSIHNMVLSFTTISTISATLIQLQCVHIGFVCLCLQLLANIAMSCSLLQIMFICIERLFAMFSFRNTSIWSFPYTCIYTTSILGTAAYVTVIFVMYADFDSASCKPDEIFDKNYWRFQLFIAIKRLVFLCITSIVYVIVFVRLKASMNKISPFPFSEHNENNYKNTVNSIKIASFSGEVLTRGSRWLTKVKSPGFEQSNKIDNIIQQTQEQSTPTDASGPARETLHGTPGRIKKFRRSMVTLIIVIIATSACVLPSVIINIMSALTFDRVTTNTIEFTNIFIVLNPLIDPIVYVLRIKDFRNQLRCRNS